MAAKHASVKLSTEFLNDARREADAFKRSVAAQVEHWARIGRAYEKAPGVGVDRVREALDGRLKLEDLSNAEVTAVLERFGAEWSPETEARYAALGREAEDVAKPTGPRRIRKAG